MNRLVAEVRATAQKKPCRPGKKKNQYEYDSDEDTEGGTWEHKARKKEMTETEGKLQVVRGLLWLQLDLFRSCRLCLLSVEKAHEATERGRGKHHIGDFLPPEELDKFVEKVIAVKEGRAPGQYATVGRGSHHHVKWSYSW